MMSADSCAITYGLSFDLSDDEVEACELRRDPRMQAARTAGLQHYWGAFGVDGERYRLFVGLVLGKFGPENSLEGAFLPTALQAAFKETDGKLKSAGFEGDAKLLVQFAIDL